MATYNLAVPSTATANICCSGTSDGQIWGPADVYGCYLDDGDAGTFALVAFRFPIATAMAGTDITSATLTLDRLPAAYGDSGTNGAAGIRCEASATPATFTASGTGRPYGRTWRTAQVDYTFVSGGDAATIDLTTLVQDLAATYGIANLTAITVGVGALTIGWKTASLSYRAISNDGSGTLPQLSIITSSGTEVARGVVCYSFSGGLGAGAPLVQRAASTQLESIQAATGGASSAKSALALAETIARGSQSANVSQALDFSLNSISSAAAQGAAVVAKSTIADILSTPTIDGGRIEGKAVVGSAITALSARGSTGGGSAATVLVRNSTALPNGGGMPPIATFRDLNSNRHGFKDTSSGGIGQLCHICTPKTSSAGLYGYTSWSGDTWVPVALDIWDPFYYVKSSIQGSDGKVHLVYVDSNAGQIRYRRLTLSHGNDGKINGATRDVEILIGPIGYLESTIDIRECVAQNGSHWIVFAKLAETNTTVQMGKWPIDVSSQTQVVGMNDSVAFTTIATGIVNQHDHGVQLAQFAGTLGIVCMWGYAIAELSLEPLRRVLLTPSGSTTWSVGSTVTESVANAAVGMMCSANGAIYRVASADNPGSCVYFDRYNSDGSLTANVFPTISMPTRNSFACLEVNADATKAFVIASDYSASLIVAHLEGGAWSSNVGSVTDCYGLGGFGFGTGLCVLDQELALTNGGLYTISVLEEPGAEPVLVGRAAVCSLTTLGIAFGAIAAGKAPSCELASSAAVSGAALGSMPVLMASETEAPVRVGSSVGATSYGLSNTPAGAFGAILASSAPRTNVVTWAGCGSSVACDGVVLGLSDAPVGTRSSAEASATAQFAVLSGVLASSSVNVIANIDGKCLSLTSLGAFGLASAAGAVTAQIESIATVSQSVGVVAQVTGHFVACTQLAAVGAASATASATAWSGTVATIGAANVVGLGMTGYFPGGSSLIATGSATVERSPRLGNETACVVVGAASVDASAVGLSTLVQFGRGTASAEATAYMYVGSYYRSVVPTTSVGEILYRHRPGFIGVTIRDHK